MSGNAGNLYYSDARGVQIAGKYLDGSPSDRTPHSAVHGDFNFIVDSMKEAQALISAWPEIMQKLSEFVKEILEAIPKPETG